MSSAIALGLVWGTGQAIPVQTTTDTSSFFSALDSQIDTSGPYFSLFTDSDAGNLAHYDPALELLTIPGSTNAALRFRPHALGSPPTEFYFNGTFDLSASLTPSGQSSGGLFTIFGSVPGIGINDPTLLLATTLDSLDIAVTPEGDYLAFELDTLYADPKLGSVSSHLILDGFLDDGPVGAHPPTSDVATFLSTPWIGGPADYWDVWSTRVSVAEPSPLCLFGIGLTCIILLRRTRRPGSLLSK
jgi:hypothetical protein